MSETMAAIFWQRRDTPGHDACRLTQSAGGFALEGQAVFEHDGAPCAFAYRVTGDRLWQTRHATVSGFINNDTIGLEIGRTVGGDWLLNGALQSDVAGQRDLDLGFTPATNLIAIRRFALDIGAETAAPTAYLFFPETRPPALRLTVMHQKYRRLDRERYDYTGINYHEVLTVSDIGFVLDYPGLWSGRLWNA